MALPLTYNVRNVFIRWRATLATVLGVALVVAVYVLVQSLAIGLEKSSRNTGDPRNVMIVRKGSTAESSSIITRDQFKIVEYLPQIDQDTNGQPLVSADVVVLISLPRRESNGEAHVLFRGVSPAGIDLRPQVSLVAGRWFTPGKREVVVSRRLAARFANFDIGNKFKIASKELTVVGWSDGRNSAFVQQRVVALRGEEGLQAVLAAGVHRQKLLAVFLGIIIEQLRPRRAIGRRRGDGARKRHRW